MMNKPLLILLAVTVLMVSAHADESALAAAQKMLDEGNAAAAYDMLKPLENDLAGDANFDYLFGLAALDSGNKLDAVFALERVVDLNPTHGPARAELARAYLALGETDDAQTEFEKVQAMDVPPEALQTIERYMSNIELFHDATRTRFRPWVRTAIGYDTNVNGATSVNGLIPIPLLNNLGVFVAGAENSPIWTIGAGTRFTSPLDVDRGLSLFGRIGLDHRLTVDEADFSTLIGSGQLGIKKKQGKNTFSLAADANIAKIDGGTGIRGDQESAGATAEWQYTPGKYDQITTFANFSLVRYPEQRVRDVNRFTGGIGYGHAFADSPGTPIVFASVFGGFDDAQSNSRGDHFGREFFGGRLGASYQPGERHTLSVSMTYQHSDYDEPDPAFLFKRDDDFFSVIGQYRFQYDENWSVTPHIGYTNNDSNIVINDYDRFEVMVTFRNDF